MSNCRQYYLMLNIVVFMSLSIATDCMAQAEPDHWYKGNTHTHTLWSDGNQFLEMAIDWYKQHGYEFLALSDHDVLSEGEMWMKLSEIEARTKEFKDPDVDVIALCNSRFGDDWVQTRQSEKDLDGNTELEVRLRNLSEIRSLFEEPGKFLLIQGEEISDMFEDIPIHTNALNLQEVIPKTGGDSVRDMIRRHLLAAREAEKRSGEPVLAHVNHPNYYWGITAEDLAYVLEEEFFEVYNGSPSVNNNGDDTHPGVERLWDIANTIRIGELQAPPLFAVAADDSHQYYGNRWASPGRGWIMVRAAELTPEAIFTAMYHAQFYASSGVKLRDIRYDVQTRRITIEINPAPGEHYTTTFYGTMKDYDDAGVLPAGDDGKHIDDARIFGNTIGAALSIQGGTTASYQLTGDELYVRATISSDHAPDNPMYKDQVKQAWTQPVGWKRNVHGKSESRLQDPFP